LSIPVMRNTFLHGGRFSNLKTCTGGKSSGNNETH
jgi:hypothetical protein